MSGGQVQGTSKDNSLVEEESITGRNLSEIGKTTAADKVTGILQEARVSRAVEIK